MEHINLRGNLNVFFQREEPEFLALAPRGHHEEV